MPTIELHPGGKSLQSSDGSGLRDILFSEGVEFPCGGLGRCSRCKVRVLRGHWPSSLADWRRFSADELRRGWRLACQGVPGGNLVLEVAQWNSPILADETPFDFTPTDGLGIAIDVGTTTLASQLLDLRTGRIRAVATALNAQGVHGADAMTRLAFAIAGGSGVLTRLIRKQVCQLIKALLHKSGLNVTGVRSVVLVGNTAMHHLFCGLPVDQLAGEPFQPFATGLQTFTGAQLGWGLSGPRIFFLPPIGGFVGSDILAGIVATRLHESSGTTALLDLGTNGEIVVARNNRILCASTAAGPAFEAARISAGMRAAKGAIAAVRPNGESFECDVLGGGKPLGICGSGLVDAIAAGLDTGLINPSGKFSDGIKAWSLADSVALLQKDVRELQLAKGAIAAGLRLLLNAASSPNESAPDRVYLAGAFGNYVNRESACRIGLLPITPGKIIPAGNTALLGAKLALFPEYEAQFEAALQKTEHISLNECPEFQELFVEQMRFPSS